MMKRVTTVVTTLATSMLLAVCGQVESASATDTAPAAGPTATKTCVLDPSLTVYFGFDHSSLDTDADAVLAYVASSLTNCEAKHIDVVGYTDTAEPDPQGLSQKRAEKVAAILKALGVKADIRARGAGSSELAVKTGPNVREPQNRRVTMQAE